MSIKSGTRNLMPESETEKLLREIENLQARVAEQTAEISRLKELAETDAVTGIGNRRSFDKEIRRRYLELQRDDRGFCLMIIDVDRFKSINDQFGHVAGDRLLLAVASVLSRNMRGSDIVTRIGGDEFGIILPGANVEQATHAAQRLLKEAISGLQAELGEIPVGISVGICEATKGMIADQIIDLADRAMYQAKEQGGNQFVIATPSLSEQKMPGDASSPGND